MPCPHCASPMTARQHSSTALGYQTFGCGACRRSFNERTGTPFNFLEYPTDIVLLVVLWRLHYKLSLRDAAEMFQERGFVFRHEAVREWEERFAPLLTERLRAGRHGKAGRPGMWMRPPSRSTVAGVISLGPSTGTATWSIRCSVRRVIGKRPSASSAGLVGW
jgi:transposase-like protein